MIMQENSSLRYALFLSTLRRARMHIKVRNQQLEYDYVITVIHKTNVSQRDPKDAVINAYHFFVRCGSDKPHFTRIFYEYEHVLALLKLIGIEWETGWNPIEPETLKDGDPLAEIEQVPLSHTPDVPEGMFVQLTSE